MKQTNILKRVTDKLYGGLHMSWPAVILFAVACAVLTAIFLIVPIFSNTSFYRMGVTFEAWVFFAVIIMANCKKPLESALKTFVFFLISQPLIYLFQVPFAELGWQLFGYYRYWFIWTLLTLPMAYIGWYIRKKNWLSLLILLPILFLLTNDYVEAFGTAAKHFPRLLVTALFCLGQVLLYLYVFTEKLWQKLLGFLLPLAAVLILLLVTPRLQLNGTSFLPDEPVLSENATVEVAKDGKAAISIADGQSGMIRIQTEEYGSTEFTIRDGETEYRYTLVVYEDESGHSQVEIIKQSD